MAIFVVTTFSSAERRGPETGNEGVPDTNIGGRNACAKAMPPTRCSGRQWLKKLCGSS
jgi:hypothetical protein